VKYQQDLDKIFTRHNDRCLVLILF